MGTKSKIKDTPLYSYDKYECWWEDHASACEWKSIKDAEKDKPEICFTEGYLLKIDKKTGGNVWKKNREKRVSWSTPVIDLNVSPNQIVISSNGSIYELWVSV